MLARYLTYLYEIREPALLVAPRVGRIYANPSGEVLIVGAAAQAYARRLADEVAASGEAVVAALADVELTFAPLFDERTRVDAIIAVAVPPAKLPRMLYQLQEPLRGFGRILQALPLIVMTARSSGAIDFLNARWYEVTGGQRSGTSPAKSFADAIGEAHRATAHARWSEGVARGAPFEFDLQLRTVAGMRWFEVRAEPLAVDGRAIKWVVALHDIDEQVRARERERVVVETLQRSMLPTAMPTVAGVSFDVAYTSATPDRLVGGDWYDAFDLGDGRVAVAIGDVTGHGLDASIVMGQLRQIMRAASREDWAPEHVLASANRVLFAEGSALASAFYGVLDTVSMRLTYASAGHPPPIVADGAGVHELETDGVILGAVPQAHIRTFEAPLSSSSALVLYTDGVVEARRDVAVGQRRLCDTLAQWARSGFTLTAAEVQSAVIGDGANPDDAAMLVLRFPASDRMSFALPATRENAQRLRRAVARFLDATGGEERDVFDATLAVAEAVNNAVLHAYPDGGGDVRVGVRRVRQGVVATVEDGGIWPDGMPALAGHGLDIMEKLVPAVQVRRGSHGSKVSFRIRVPATVGA